MFIFLPRFLIEYIKNVQVVKEVEMIAEYGINMGQLLSIPFIVIGIIMVIYALIRPRQQWTYPEKFADAEEPKKK